MSNDVAVRGQNPMSTLSGYIMSRRDNLAAVLPKTLTPERLCKIALAAASRNPTLLQATPESFYVALHSCAQLGLEPNTPLGAAYLIPFRNNKAGTMEVQFIPGYRGLIDLARRSGQIQNIYAYAVREGDEFSYALGLRPDIVHVPKGAPDANLTHVYAVAKLKDGGEQFVVMTRAEVDLIRGRSRSKDNGPWVTDYEAMALKTAIRRLVKYLPMSIELAAAIEHDDAVETGTANLVVDAITGEVQAEAPKSRTASMKAKLKPAAVIEPTPETLPGDDLSFNEELIPTAATNAAAAIDGADSRERPANGRGA
jgi:recombination protein RecT